MQEYCGRKLFLSFKRFVVFRIYKPSNLSMNSIRFVIFILTYKM